VVLQAFHYGLTHRGHLIQWKADIRPSWRINHMPRECRYTRDMEHIVQTITWQSQVFKVEACLSPHDGDVLMP
jgi:hypothetical protein